MNIAKEIMILTLFSTMKATIGQKPENMIHSFATTLILSVEALIKVDKNNNREFVSK
jgi:hypothetical protein